MAPFKFSKHITAVVRKPSRKANNEAAIPPVQNAPTTVMPPKAKVPITLKPIFRTIPRFLTQSGLRARRVPFSQGAALDAVQTGLKIGAAVAEATSVPIAKMPLQIASTIVEIAQDARTNKEDCLLLAQEVEGYIGILSRCEEEKISEQYLYVLQEFQDKLEATEQDLRGVATQRLLKRLYHHQRNKGIISRCRQRLDTAFRKFEIHDRIVAIQTSRHTHELSVTETGSAVLQAFFF